LPMSSLIVAEVKVESLLDWLNFWVALAGAVGTVGAVAFAIVSTSRSNKDTRIFQREAREAESRTRAADLRTQVAIERQAQAAERMIALEKELESDRRANARQIEVERKAARQALDIKITTHADPSGSNIEKRALGYAYVEIRVYNGSEKDITDILVRLDMPPSEKGDPRFEETRSLAAGRGMRFLAQNMVLTTHQRAFGLPVTVAFTDHFGDRWQMSSDSMLSLVRSRVIEEVGGEDGAGESIGVARVVGDRK
jgi:hypothetical protein